MTPPRDPAQAIDLPGLGSTVDVVRHPEFATPFYRVSVKALIFDADDRLLVVQEPAGHWELPGGGWEHGETLEECLARELREEVGACLGSVDLATQRAWPSAGARRRYHRLKLTVQATLESPVLTPGGEILAAGWVTPEELSALTIADGDEPLRQHILTVWPGRVTPA